MLKGISSQKAELNSPNPFGEVKEVYNSLNKDSFEEVYEIVPEKNLKKKVNVFTKR